MIACRSRRSNVANESSREDDGIGFRQVGKLVVDYEAHAPLIHPTSTNHLRKKTQAPLTTVSARKAKASLANRLRQKNKNAARASSRSARKSSSTAPFRLRLC